MTAVIHLILEVPLAQLHQQAEVQIRHRESDALGKTPPLEMQIPRIGLNMTSNVSFERLGAAQRLADAACCESYTYDGGTQLLPQ